MSFFLALPARTRAGLVLGISCLSAALLTAWLAGAPPKAAPAVKKKASVVSVKKSSKKPARAKTST